jgi:hypothetical protein
MSHAASQPNLRLVGAEGDESRVWAAQQQSRLAVIKENRLAAAGLDPTDPRWVLASQTQARLQGATLTPERRDQLIRNGVKMGLRPFEANLVIALVQDRARAHEPLSEAGPMLKLVRQPMNERASTRSAGSASWPMWFAAVAAALAVAALLVRWLTGE